LERKWGGNGGGGGAEKGGAEKGTFGRGEGRARRRGGRGEGDILLFGGVAEDVRSNRLAEKTAEKTGEKTGGRKRDKSNFAAVGVSVRAYRTQLPTVTL